NNGYDLVLMITDGAPNSYLSDQGDYSSTQFRLQSVEEAVLRANELKYGTNGTNGAKVISVGVGDGITNANSQANLKAISGDRVDSDYYLVADWEDLAGALRSV